MDDGIRVGPSQPCRAAVCVVRKTQRDDGD